MRQLALNKKTNELTPTIATIRFNYCELAMTVYSINDVREVVRQFKSKTAMKQTQKIPTKRYPWGWNFQLRNSFLPLPLKNQDTHHRRINNNGRTQLQVPKLASPSSSLFLLTVLLGSFEQQRCMRWSGMQKQSEITTTTKETDTHGTNLNP